MHAFQEEFPSSREQMELPARRAPDSVLREYYLGGIASLYAFACISPAATVYVSAGQLGGGWQPYFGIEILVLNLPWVLGYPQWWANALLALGLCSLLRRVYGLAACLGAAGSLLAVSTLWRGDVGVHLGYCFWLGSQVVLVVAALHCGWRNGSLHAGESQESINPSQIRANFARVEPLPGRGCAPGSGITDRSSLQENQPRSVEDLISPSLEQRKNTRS
jgi:hypothetical protein